MLIFWPERLVFLATPRTGSTAVETALAYAASVAVVRPPALKHCTARRFHRLVLPFLGDTEGRDFTLTALMREPLDWLGSWYRYRQRDRDDLATSTRDISFDDFVQAYCRDDPPDFARIGSQARFLSGDGPSAQVRHIFVYERMAEFQSFLERRLRTSFVLQQTNVSAPQDLYLSTATTAQLHRHAAADFELYGKIAGR